MRQPMVRISSVGIKRFWKKDKNHKIKYLKYKKNKKYSEYVEFYIVDSWFRVMINWGVVFGLVSVSVLVIVIISIALPGLEKHANDETQKNLLDQIDSTQKLMCGMPDELGMIFDSVGLISSEKFDNKAKGIYQQMQWGKDIESCDVVYLYDQLDTEQKKRLNWLELSCDAAYC